MGCCASAPSNVEHAQVEQLREILHTPSAQAPAVAPWPSRASSSSSRFVSHAVASGIPHEPFVSYATPSAAQIISAGSVLHGKLAHYKLIAKVQKGFYAQVWRATNLGFGQGDNALPAEVAIKIVDVSKTFDGREGVQREIDIQTALEHPYIAPLYEAIDDPASIGHVYLVMELAVGGELYGRLEARGAYAEEDAAILMAEVFDALTYLHSLGVVHRDIKPENICFAGGGSDGSMSVDADDASIKLIDFGYATLLALDGSPRRELGPKGWCGTCRYVSPEQLTENRPDTTQHDLWAAGVVLYTMLCGYPPFTQDEPAIYEDIKAAKYEFAGERWAGVSEGAKELVRALLEVDPERRLTAVQAAEHRWVVTCGGSLEA